MYKSLLFFCFLYLPLASFADCTLALKTEGAIGPAALDYIERGIERAQQLQCESILYEINTPGGSLQSTRLIIEKILNAPIPFLCLVAPSGAHAGSAGAIILQACHVNGAFGATNIGAATPVTPTGDIPDDLKRKIFNDTTSLLDSLTELRNRNVQFGRDIVIKGAAVSATEAKKRGAIDVVVETTEAFLSFASSRQVKMSGGNFQVVKVGPLQTYRPDLRFRLLDLVTHPQVAYLIFMASLALLYFELTHPGMIAPGVAGLLGLVVSLISFHMLAVQWAGLLLILLGIIFLIAELFVPSFGALGIGGLLSFVAGSLFLFDEQTGALPLALVLPTAFGLFGIMLTVGYLALSAHRRPKKMSGSLVGGKGLVSRADEAGRSGKIEIQGEIWNFTSQEKLNVGDPVEVVDQKGLSLFVTKV